MHSFAATDKYVILCMWSAALDESKFIAYKSYRDAIDFKKQRNTICAVVSREERRVAATYKSDPFYCSYTINAFDIEDGIYIDLCRFEDIRIFADSMGDNLRYNENCPELTIARYRLENLSSVITARLGIARKAGEKCISECKLEFPKVHPRSMRKHYCYVYGVDCDGKLFDKLTKNDVKPGERLSWGIDRGVQGEPTLYQIPMDGTRTMDVFLLC